MHLILSFVFIVVLFIVIGYVLCINEETISISRDESC